MNPIFIFIYSKFKISYSVFGLRCATQCTSELSVFAISTILTVSGEVHPDIACGMIDAHYHVFSSPCCFLPVSLRPHSSLSLSTVMALNFDDEYDWGLHIAGPSRTKKHDHGVMDVDPPQPTTSHGHADATIDVIPQAIAEETPFQQLIRHWMNERHAPDILHAQDGLLGRLLDHIKKQVRLSYCHPLCACTSSCLRAASLHAA